MTVFDANYGTLHQIVFDSADDIAYARNISIVLNADLLNEAFDQAYAYYTQLSTSSATFYREAGCVSGSTPSNRLALHHLRTVHPA